MADGNAVTETTNTKKPSALEALLKRVEGQKVNATDKKTAADAFKKAAGKRAELQAALDKHDQETADLAVKMVTCFGKKAVVVDGVRYAPTSRGERVYYKRLGGADDVEL